MSNDPAAIGRNLVSRAVAPLVLAVILLAPAAARAALTVPGGKLTVAGSHQLGQSVALAGDGTIALAGAPGAGSARVLARSGGTWADTGAPLLPAAGPDATGFGAAVALSADGAVALVGAPDADDGAGAAWVFVRSGSGWTQAGRLTGVGEDGDGQFGAAVALSADGSVAVVGAPFDGGGAGAVWVFARAGGSWVARGAKLVAIGTAGAALVGRSVAVAGDGATVVAGGPGDNGGAGAIWSFARGGDGLYWQDGMKLAVAGSSGLGSSLAIDRSGATLLSGGPADGVGAAYVFVRSGGVYVQQGPKLTVTGTGPGKLGAGVALSADGDVALLGAPADASGKGGAWRVERTGTIWTVQERIASGSGGAGEFGTSVALAADGHTALVGAPNDGSGKGAVWTFAEAPAVTAIAPALGTVTGGTAVTVTGTALTGAAAVRFGGTPALAVHVDAPTQLTAVAPASAIGTVHVTVETSGGTSATTTADVFASADVPGAPDGVAASAGDGTATVTFTAPAADGGRPVDGYIVTVAPGGRTVDAAGSPVAIDGLANGTAVTFTVRARNAIGLGPASAASAPVTPRPPAPVVTALSVHESPTAGGTVVTVTGAHLTGATAVRFGTAPAVYAVDGDGQITATAPPHAAGDVHVTVTGAGGSSAATDDDLLTYLAPPPPPDPPAAPVVARLSPSEAPFAGGTLVTITGAHLTGATAVRFGTAPAAFAVDGDGQITATSPAHAAGDVHVTITGPGGSSPATETDRFTYLAPPPPDPPAAPVVTRISAHLGAVAGGTVVSITGDHLAGALSVRFGAVPAAFAVDDDTRITATAPAGAPGQVHVTVTTAGGASAGACADAFAYLPPGGETLPAHRCAVAYTLRSTGTGRAPQAVALSVPGDGHATLLAGDDAPVAVLTGPEGRYALDAAHAVVTFTPAAGFAGAAAGVRYRVHGDEATAATATYTPEVALPAPPTAPGLATSGAAATAQHATVAVPDDTAVTLLDAAGAAATTVLVSGEGRYDLDAATGTITFRPAAAFTGRGHGVRYRLADAYGQTAVGSYVPTVIAGPSAPPVRVRLTTAPLSVADADGAITLGCGVTAGALADCRIALVADVLGGPVVVGTGSARPATGAGDVLVTVRLSALGRDLSRQPGGVAVRAEASAAVAGRSGRMGGAVGLHAVARAFVLRHAVRFAAGTATLRTGERRYLDALAHALSGVRRVECVGTARDVRRPSRSRLARARARIVCGFLRSRLAPATAITARGEWPSDRRGPDGRVDVIVRY